METKKVWFVTGASKGLGFELVKKLLSEGFQVAATSRTVESLISSIGETSENFLPLGANITDNNDIKSAIDKTVEHFGKLMWLSTMPVMDRSEHWRNLPMRKQEKIMR